MAAIDDPYSTDALVQRQLRRAGPSLQLPPEEEASVLSRLGHTALGGLAWVGSTLDKALGGRAVRGLLGGAPQELASIIPFSDSLGISDPASEVSGVDLLRDLQGQPRGGETSLAEHAGGLGISMLLDPASYLTFGSKALTGLGHTAEKAGVLPAKASARMQGLALGTPELDKLAQAGGKSAAELAGQPLGGLVGVGLPLGESQAALGTGKVAQKVADTVGAGIDLVKYSKPGRELAALFDPSVKGLKSAAGQRAMREVGTPELRAGEEAAMREHHALGRQLEAGGALDQGPQLRQAAERVPVGGQLAPEGQQVADTMRQRLAEMKRADTEMGRAVPDYGEHYFPRAKTALQEEVGPAQLRGREGLPDSRGNLKPRLDAFRDVPGETEGLNALLRDPQLRQLYGDGSNPLQAHAYARQKLGVTPQDEAWLHANAAAPPRRMMPDPAGGPNPVLNPDYDRYAKLVRQRDQAEELAKIAGTLPPEYAEKGLSYFGNHPLADYTAYQVGHARRQAGDKALHEALAQAADRTAAAGSVSVADALKGARLGDVLDQSGQLAAGASKQQLERLKALGKIDPAAGPEALAKVFVPADVAQDLARYGQASAPAATNPFVKVWDWITQTTKAGMTSLWPAFHTRNGLTGLYMNWVTGKADPRYSGPLAYLRPFMDADLLRQGKAVPGANLIKGLEKLTDEEATRRIAELLKEAGARTPRGFGTAGEQMGRGALLDEAGELGRAGKLTLPGTPAAAEKGLAATAADYALLGRPGKPAEPGLKGVLGEAAKPLQAGKELGHTVDDLNRVSAFIADLRQGFEPSIAGARARAAHYDYTALTDFERTVMRRVVPFYGWMRKNVPFTVQELATAPGGKMATALKGTAGLRQQEGLLPEYLGQGVAMPLGAEADGTRRYLSNLGLPFEDAFANLHVGPGGVGKTLAGLLSETNPLIKAPVELATGKQLYSGRDLHDLYGPTGTPELDQLVMNSPLSRAYTTARTLVDPRKELDAKLFNVLGPGRVTDVDMDRQRTAAARSVVEDVLRHNPNVRHFEEMYVRPEDVANLTPEELTILRLYKTIEARQQAQARAAR